MSSITSHAPTIDELLRRIEILEGKRLAWRRLPLRLVALLSLLLLIASLIVSPGVSAQTTKPSSPLAAGNACSPGYLIGDATMTCDGQTDLVSSGSSGFSTMFIQSTATNGTGLQGDCPNGTNCWGLYGTAAAGIGVEASGGVSGVSASGNTGVIAFGTAAGVSASASSDGVDGSGSVNGILGTSTSTSGFGVHGTGPGTGIKGTSTASGDGVFGTSPSGIGVHGTGPTGIFGSASTSTGTGVKGSGTGSGDGVFGTSVSGSGVHGTGATGVYGSASTSSGIGVKGANTSSGMGIEGLSTSGIGGYFSGSVPLHLVPGTLTSHPVLCSAGDVYVDSQTTTHHRLWYCVVSSTSTTAGTWDLIGP